MLAVKYFNYLDQLNNVSSRLEMIAILAKMYGEMDADEVDKATYLLFGNLGPSYLAAEFGMAEKMVVRAIAKAFGVGPEIVVEKFKRSGDLGLAVAELAPLNKESDLSISDLYERLKEIATKSGQGSQEIKVDLLVGLLREFDANSAKYLTRIPIGKLRIGVGEMTALDGLSWLVTGNKSMHVVLEDAYNVAADVGILAKEVLRLKEEDKEAWKGRVVKNMEDMKSRMGVPMVMALCNRMATFDEVVNKLGKVAVEPKYDGTRVQIHFWKEKGQAKFLTFSRNLENSSYMFPELRQLGEILQVDEAILDCEAMGIDAACGKWAVFQVTMTRKRKHGIDEILVKVPLKFMVFDVLYAKGGVAESWGAKGDVHKWSLFKRKELLKKIIKPNSLMELTPVEYLDDVEEIRKRHKEFLEEGFEGVVLKQSESEYVPGRKKNVWIKKKEVEDDEAKLPDTIDCVVMGYYRGEGRRGALGLGSLLLGVRGKEAQDLVNGTMDLFAEASEDEKYWTVSKLGSKLTDEQLVVMRERLDAISTDKKDRLYEVPRGLVPDVWVKPEIVVEVAADNLTKSPLHTARLALRFPRLVRVREDKGPQQTTSIGELWQMFRMQKG